MYYVYVLVSQKTGRTYVGFTGDLKQRFAVHNTGGSKYTSKHGPWQSAYYEAYVSRADAQDRERALKIHGHALALLKKRIIRSLKGDGQWQTAE